jgi:hypothetical protein
MPHRLGEPFFVGTFPGPLDRQRKDRLLGGLIADSGRCRSAFRDDADHSFRGDPDQLIEIAGRVIAMPRNVFHRAK